MMASFKEKYDWMFRRMMANLPVTPEYFRYEFERWWNKLAELVEEDKRAKRN